MKIKNQRLIQRFREFVLGIKKDDKVGIVYHSDPDGVCSAAIFSNIIRRLRKKEADYSAYTYSPFIPQDIISSIRKKRINKLIFCDLSIDQIPEIKAIEKLSDVLILDHHKLYRNVNSGKTVLIKPQMVFASANPDFYCCSKLCLDLGKKVVNLKGLDWLAAIGILGDSGYDYWKPFVNKVFKRYRMQNTARINDSELYKITKMIFHSIAYNIKNTKVCYDLLCSSKTHKELYSSKLQECDRRIKKEIRYWNSNVNKLAEVYPKLGLVFDNIKPKYFINPSVIKSLSQKYPDKTVVITQDMNKNTINISARRYDGKIAVNELLERSIKNLHRANAGGHRSAAGAIIQKKDFFRFKENIFRLLSDMPA
ncbi:hypothetical protein KY366_02715 [Candidatus Woesearchaeota archaeon]|nr:hypothetical protein [Candidatus Woesearchaeota archaeon]